MIFNNILSYTQDKLDFVYKNSLFLQKIDALIFVSILAVLLSSTLLASDGIGFIALITMFLTFIKVVFKKGEKFEPNLFELVILIYFMIVVVSLAGSTLFVLSLKGFMKTFTYLGFYVSVVHYLKDNKAKIPFVLSVIALSVGFEGIVGFMQNFAHVEEISTWQDVSNLNPEEVMTRVYGTLKPYNPNLLGGYFVAGIPSLFGLSALYLYLKKLPAAIISICLSLISVVALFLTGCRGSYIGCIVIFAGLFLISAKFLWKTYKKIYFTLLGGMFVIVSAALIFISSLRARVFSIFAMRQDSSNSFRFNVYQSSIDMFKDNWLLGIGVGNKNFREIYGLYMKTGFDALSAYNIFLETAVESGIFALIAFLIFLILLVIDSVKYICHSCDVKRIIYISVALVSIVGMLVHGLVDTVFFRPQIQFVFWTMVAISSSVLKEQYKRVFD